MLTAVFVDDILIASSSDAVVIRVKTMFHKNFGIKDMGLAAEFSVPGKARKSSRSIGKESFQLSLRC